MDKIELAQITKIIHKSKGLWKPVHEAREVNAESGKIEGKN